MQNYTFELSTLVGSPLDNLPLAMSKPRTDFLPCISLHQVALVASRPRHGTDASYSVKTELYNSPLMALRAG